jgi:hypothetical protein
LALGRWSLAKTSWDSLHGEDYGSWPTTNAQEPTTKWYVQNSVNGPFGKSNPPLL